ncbi:DUF6577 family protein [Phnomibacter ginsenosidimutans]|uniref:Uncharacterized protein n=1 Tax=Phnomibacter ginsenosidimutans TaxID=2676868 RepID=A0A6I6G2B0_9BACT|nr:DUF6577 family protein [Phnomibacter ginsenosidimutans]QGW26716.1 hypothetical protein GLV81_00095 [Phnomibacter ginsenosidimutans]
MDTFTINLLMNTQELAAYLKNRWPGLSAISTSEIMAELRRQFPGTLDNTLSWRLSQLTKENLIQRVGRGQYSFLFKPEYNAELSLKSKRTINRIRALCNHPPAVWDTSMLDDLIAIETTVNWLFIEVDRPELDQIFANAQQFSKKIFANPDKETIARYMLPVEEAIILIPQVSETPIISQGDYSMLALEGLLVNVYWYYDKYFKPLGYDIDAIFRNALKRYNVNTSKLLRFAGRRDKRSEIEQLLKKHSI